MSDLAVSEVVDGELVDPKKGPPPPQLDLYTRKRRAQIIEALTGKLQVQTEEGKKPIETKAFLADAARFAGIRPDLLYAWLDHGRTHPTGPLGRFAREVDRIRAEHNTELKSKMEAYAEKKNDWMAVARLGEQSDPETWARPSDEKAKSGTVNNIIDKLVIVHGQAGNPLTSGD